MKRTFVLVHICIIILLVAVCYYPSLTNGFVSLDDGVMLYQNEKILGLSAGNVIKCFTEIHWGLYHPLVLLSYAIEFHFFGLNPAVYHATNLYLHFFNCVLVYWLFLLLSGNARVAFVTALFFGIHPLHVESVAWITERKDVFYAVFYLGACISYLHYLKNGRKGLHYTAALVLFTLSLLSKPMAASLPLLLILFDYMSTGRPGVKDLANKVPFFLIAAVFAVTAVVGQRSHRFFGSSWFLGFLSNCLEADYNVILYAYKTIVPVKLSIVYPYFIKDSRLMENYIFYSPLPGSIMAVFVIFSLKYTKKVLYGALFFLITLLPAANLVPFALGLPGDRYTYIPLLGCFYLFGEGSLRLFDMCRENNALRAALVLVFSAVVASSCVLTRQRCGVWKNSYTLMSDVVKNLPRSPNTKFAYNALAWFYMCRGDLENAEDCNEKSYALDNNYFGYYYMKSQIAYLRKDYTDALKYVNRINSEWLMLEVNMQKSRILYALGDYAGAMACCDEIIQTGKQDSRVYSMKAKLFFKEKDYGKAVSEASLALRANPYNADALVLRSLSYKKLGMTAEAALDLKRSFEIEAKRARVNDISAESPVYGSDMTKLNDVVGF